MEILYQRGFPTPIPISHNRHVVAMSRVHGFPMCQIRSGGMGDVLNKHYFDECMSILLNLARHGLVHCDLNEFNIMILNQANASATPGTGDANVAISDTETTAAATTSASDICVPTTVTLPQSESVPSPVVTSALLGVVLIDFPQMVSTDHPNAEELFTRDKEGLVKFFSLKMKYLLTGN